MPSSASNFKTKKRPSYEEMEKQKVNAPLTNLEKQVKYRQGIESENPQGKKFTASDKTQYSVRNIPSSTPTPTKTVSVSARPVQKQEPAKKMAPSPKQPEREFVRKKDKSGNWQTVLKK